MTDGGQFTTRLTQQFYSTLPGVSSQNILTGLLLYDFVTGKADIRSQHQAALQRYIYPHAGPGTAILVIGFASRRGGDRENMNLSFHRALNVGNRIGFQTGRAGNLTVRQFGEDLSQQGDENSAYRRAVLVIVYRIPPYREPPPRPREQPLPFFNRFKIRLMGGLEGGELLVGADYHFEIDYDDSQANAPPSAPCEYSYLAIGGGIGAPLGTQGGRAWNRFNAHRNCTPRDFSGRASLGGHGASLFDRSVGEATFSMFPNRGPEVVIRNFQSELGASIGYSRTYGGFAISGF